TALDREWGAFDELHGKAAGHLAGQDGNYLEILKALAGKAADLTPAPAAEAWRTFAGDSARNLVLRQATGRLDRLPQLDGPQWRVPLVTYEAPVNVLVDARFASFHPLIASEQVLVADAGQVSSYGLGDGKRLWEYHLPGNDRLEEADAGKKLT